MAATGTESVPLILQAVAPTNANTGLLEFALQRAVIRDTAFTRAKRAASASRGVLCMVLWSTPG